MYKEIFGQRLKKARTDLSFTQEYVANELKLDRSALSKWESGDLEPNLETIGKLADFYFVSVDWLLGTNGGKNNPLSNGKNSIA